MSTYCWVFKIVLHENTGKTSEKIVGSDQDRIGVKIDVNEKFSIRCLGKSIYGSFLASGEDKVEGEVADIEGMVTYHRSRVEGGTDLAPPD